MEEVSGIAKIVPASHGWSFRVLRFRTTNSFFLRAARRFFRRRSVSRVRINGCDSIQLDADMAKKSEGRKMVDWHSQASCDFFALHFFAISCFSSRQRTEILNRSPGAPGFNFFGCGRRPGWGIRTTIRRNLRVSRRFSNGKTREKPRKKRKTRKK